MKKVLTILMALLCFTAMLPAEEEQENSFWDLFIDDEDGYFDVSDMLATSVGFFPIPIIITEPAVGYGGGAALLFFHQSMVEREAQMKEAVAEGKEARLAPPNISGAMGFGTQNGTWGAGGFHMGHWRNDTIRYLGALIRASVNLEFFGRPGSEIPPIKYNLDSSIILQQMTFRIKDSNFFLGAEYLFANTDTTADLPIEDLPPIKDNLKEGGVGLIAQYDTRDNIFTPNSGTKTEFKYSRYDQAFGGDSDYNKSQLKSLYWIPVHPKWVVGLRGEAQFTSGDIPFYMLPFIDLRGIPAMRYQGAHTLTVETEVRWDFTKRWSAVGFVGSGWVADFHFEDFKNSEAYAAGGVGFRYLIAKAFNMRAGADIAQGPEDTAFYLTIGSAWF